MIGWIKYLWGCNWSKENDIFDSCQVLRQHESEILNELDQRLSLDSALRSALRVANFLLKEDNIKRKPQGRSYIALHRVFGLVMNRIRIIADFG